MGSSQWVPAVYHYHIISLKKIICPWPAGLDWRGEEMYDNSGRGNLFILG
jgi:hypothetical protein